MSFFRPNVARLLERRDVTGLLKAIQHKDHRLRIEAAQALRTLGTDEAVEPLIGALRDPVSLVRCQVVSALGDLPGERATVGLIESLQDRVEAVRMEALQGLARREDPRRIECLIQAVHDPAAGVRALAVEALAGLEKPRAVSALWDALDDESDSVRMKAVQKLEARGGHPGSMPLFDLMRVRQRSITASEALQQFGNRESLSVLKALFGESMGRIRAECLRLLLTVDYSREETFDELAMAVNDPDGGIRILAAGALGEGTDPRAVEALCEAVGRLTSPSPDESWVACVNALRRLPDPRATGCLLDALSVVPAWHHPLLFEALSRVRDARSVPDIVAYLEGDHPDAGKGAAADALCKIVGREKANTFDCYRKAHARKEPKPRTKKARHYKCLMSGCSNMIEFKPGEYNYKYCFEHEGAS